MGPLQALIERAHRSDDEEFYLIHAEGCQTVGELILRVQRQQNSCDSFKNLGSPQKKLIGASAKV